jgi:hypothetical protein
MTAAAQARKSAVMRRSGPFAVHRSRVATASAGVMLCDATKVSIACCLSVSILRMAPGILSILDFVDLSIVVELGYSLWPVRALSQAEC